MPAERLRLRAWIEKEADGGRLPGLEWEDRDKGIFKVSWKHASRQCWSFPKDACVFEGWAIHSGRYRKGYDRPDPRRWKANFRCALNALPDITELPNQGIARGQDACKVYQIVRKSVKKDGHNNRHATSLVIVESSVKRSIESPGVSPKHPKLTKQHLEGNISNIEKLNERSTFFHTLSGSNSLVSPIFTP